MLDLAFCWLTSPPLSVLQWEAAPGPRDLGTAVAASGQLVTYSRDCHSVLWLHVRKRATFYKLYCSTYRVTANKRKNRPRLTWHVASSTNKWLYSFWFVVKYLFVMSPQTTDIGVKLLIRVHWSCTALLYILTISEDVVYTNIIMSVSNRAWNEGYPEVPEDFTITEKAPIRAFSWLKAPMSAFTLKTLLRHYAKRTLTPLTWNWDIDVLVGAFSVIVNLREPSFNLHFKL